MQHADLVSGLLMAAAFLVAGSTGVRAGRREWVAMMVFAAAGAFGGVFPEMCADGLNAVCRSRELRFQLPAEQYLHIIAGILEFGGITVALLVREAPDTGRQDPQRQGLSRPLEDGVGRVPHARIGLLVEQTGQCHGRGLLRRLHGDGRDAAPRANRRSWCAVHRAALGHAGVVGRKHRHDLFPVEHAASVLRRSPRPMWLSECRLVGSSSARDRQPASRADLWRSRAKASSPSPWLGACRRSRGGRVVTGGCVLRIEDPGHGPRPLA